MPRSGRCPRRARRAQRVPELHAHPCTADLTGVDRHLGPGDTTLRRQVTAIHATGADRRVRTAQPRRTGPEKLPGLLHPDPQPAASHRSGMGSSRISPREDADAPCPSTGRGLDLLNAAASGWSAAQAKASKLLGEDGSADIMGAADKCGPSAGPPHPVRRDAGHGGTLPPAQDRPVVLASRPSWCPLHPQCH